MKVIKGIKKFKHHSKDILATIGIFDGVHIGHKKVISWVVKKAKRSNKTSLVITFDPHPDKVINPKQATPLLISLEHRLRLIEELGIDEVLLLKFDNNFSKLSPQDFVKSILVKKIGIKEIVVGEDFAFGKNKAGSISILKRLGRLQGFKVTKISIAKKNRKSVSSTRIRQLILKGKLKKASTLLGRPVSVLGTVKHGTKRGRLLGFPTANIDPHHEAIPPSGVYAVRIKFENRIYNGVLNIGRRPTFYKDSDPIIEVHIFNFSSSIYNEELEIEFVKKIRKEKRFPNKEALINQIRLDESKAKRILYKSTHS